MRDILTRVAAAGLVRARWSDDIHRELRERLAEKYPDMAEGDQLDKLIAFLTASVPDCLVEGYEGLIDGLELADPDDRHVAAVALVSGAQVIVSRDRKGFSPDFLEAHDMTVKDPDDFLADIIDLPRAGPRMHQIVTEMAEDRDRSVERIMKDLRANKLPLTVTKLER